MAFNGSGTFNRVHDWTDDAANSIKIRADRMDAEFDGVATGLSTCITKDGQTTVAANLPMAGFRHTGVDDASARDHYGAVGQIQDGSYLHATSAGSAGAYTLALSPAVTAYAAGQCFTIKANHANTGAVTLNVNGVGAKAIQKHQAALNYGEIVTNDIVTVVYDGTQFQMVSPIKGGWELIETQTASAVNAVDFKLGIGSGFDEFEISLTDVNVDTDASALDVRTSTDGGSTFDAAATDYEFNAVAVRAGTAGITNLSQSTSDDKIRMTNTTIGNATTENISGTIRFNGPSGTVAHKMVSWDLMFKDNQATARSNRVVGGGSRLAAGDVDAVRVKVSGAGVFGGGTMSLYGRRK